ncbi:MAG: hypothetical protein ENTB_04662 [Enterocloster aldenensis]
MLNQIYWVAGATLGVLLGYVIHFDTTGIEFVMTALFVVMFIEQWVIVLLVVYCLKNAVFASFHGLPELIAIACIFILHKWKRNTLLSIGIGTVVYMVLVQTCFR